MKKLCLVILGLGLLQAIAYAQIWQSDTRSIKVLSFNILHGATTQGDFDLDAIAQVIKDSDPDLVALQEVDYLTNRAHKYDLVTELGWRTKMTSLFGRAMYYDGGEYGEGVLSKTSIVKSRNILLPHSEGNEPRAALEITTVLASGDTISFIGTHLDHTRNEEDRVAQAKAINSVFLSNPYPTILAGDLNAQPNSKPINILEEFWTPSYDADKIQPTFPSDNPRIKIDYIFTFPSHKWSVIETKVIADSIASDHAAYLVKLRLNKL